MTSLKLREILKDRDLPAKPKQKLYNAFLLPTRVYQTDFRLRNIEGGGEWYLVEKNSEKSLEAKVDLMVVFWVEVHGMDT